MARYKLKDRTASADWFQYTVPHTGVRVYSSSWSGLMIKIGDHLNANGLHDVTIYADDIEDAVARDLLLTHPDFVVDNADNNPITRNISLSDVVRFSKTVFLNILGGSQRVTQEEADRRAAICVNCPMNRDVANCAACGNSGSAASVVGMVTGDRKTAAHENLKTCLICGCFNRAQVWFPLEDLQRGLGKLRYELPDSCWKLGNNT